MSPQIAVRIPTELADDLDAIVATGRFETRAEAIRSAIEALVESDRRRRIGDAIVEGYERLPQHEDELEQDDWSSLMSSGGDA